MDGNRLKGSIQNTIHNLKESSMPVAMGELVN
jgi:hypothetical protein